MSLLLRHFTTNIQGYTSGLLCGVVVLTALPQTLGLARYRAALANYTKTGDEEQLSEEINTAVDKMLTKIHLSPEEEASIDFFSAYGHDMVHKGSARIRSGAIVGIPAIFNFKTLEDVARQQFQLNMEPVDWTSEGGQLLMSSLLLSERAKNFAISREIHYVGSTNAVWTHAFMKLGCFGASYMVGHALGVLFQLKQRMKRWGRFAVYGVVFSIGLGFYLSIVDLYTCAVDRKVDSRAANMGLDYAEGGVEYYSKLLQRNKALRALMGSRGAALYTPYGNEVFGVRTKHLQTSQRRDNMMKIVQDMKKESSFVEAVGS